MKFLCISILISLTRQVTYVTVMSDNLVLWDINKRVTNKSQVCLRGNPSGKYQHVIPKEAINTVEVTYEHNRTK